MLILGCDRVGSYLATGLDEMGCAVHLIDRDAESVSLLTDRVRATCCVGDLLDPDLLRCAGINEADLVITASALDDLNAAAALVALRVFEKKHVLARIDDPHRAESYRALGIDTVCSTPAVIAAFLERIESVAKA